MAPPFLRIPAEIRLMIYSHLFDAGNSKPKSPDGRRTLSIRNGQANIFPPPPSKTLTRKHYYVIDRSFHRHCYETTYHLTTKSAIFCAALMRVNRAVYEETAHLLYSTHIFDFGSDIEAVEPFLSDLTPASRRLVTHVEVYKRRPDGESDRYEWRAMCTYLCDYANLQYLRLVVQAGRPSPSPSVSSESESWDGPRELSSTDLKLLIDLGQESLQWIADVAGLKGLRDVEIVPDFCFVPTPKTMNMRVFAAVSASVDKGVTEFLRGKLGLS
ncbi:hypothetical protein HD806DRAFT_477472 [Xylariaceae sp. AK1471]|nr:hypothetical protein HD806DRAFT_477472 [Xylariaceae sp. AK1471]